MSYDRRWQLAYFESKTPAEQARFYKDELQKEHRKNLDLEK